MAIRKDTGLINLLKDKHSWNEFDVWKHNSLIYFQKIINLLLNMLEI